MGRHKEISDQEITRAARRIFLERGAGVSAAEIAKELGVSHTTLFNRFGSKEGLMLAALGPSPTVPWAEQLDEGPGESPVREQLVKHAKVMSAHFEELQEGLAVLSASGIPAYGRTPGEAGMSPHAQAIRGLSSWLKRAQGQGRLAACDTEVLAATILGALHNRAFAANVCGLPAAESDLEGYVERLIELLWKGIGVPEPAEPRSQASRSPGIDLPPRT